MRRLQGIEPEEQGAQELGFGSVKAMRLQLGNWGAPDWLTQEEVSETPKVQRPAPPKRKARGSSQPEEVPDASAAAELLNEVLDELRGAVKLLEDLSLVYQGKSFAGAYEFEGSWILPRRSYTEERWQELCKQHGYDPGVKNIYIDDVSSKHAIEASPYPPRELVVLIAAYALAGRPIEPLLKVLYPKHSQTDIEEVNRLLYETKPKGSKDGLLRTAQQFAAAVYGRKVGKGTPPESPPDEEMLAWHIAERREAGIADEKILQDILNSGRELSKQEFTRLASLGRRFPDT
jgi:hypothetical protein